MDLSEAARLLGVADSEVREVRDAGGRFEVLHHDMASHEETWREVPGAPDETSGVGETNPEIVELPAGAKVASKRRSAR